MHFRSETLGWLEGKPPTVDIYVELNHLEAAMEKQKAPVAQPCSMGLANIMEQSWQRTSERVSFLNRFP